MFDLSFGWVQALLFFFFAGLTALLAAVIGPTYDNLFVPEMSPAALFPSLGPGAGPGSFLSGAAAFSDYLLTHLVDPIVGLVGLALALVFLARAFLGRYGSFGEPLLVRLLVAVLLANFALPVADGLLGIAAVTYPLVTGWDRGAWQHWQNLGGYGLFAYSWDNGALAFVLSFALFSLVLLLTSAIALRDALLGVLLVLLPVFTILWPLPVLDTLARRAWLWFGELAFLPCVLVVPLQLAVGSSSVLLLLGYLTAAVGSPALLSMAGTHLGALGLPSAGNASSAGIQRGLGAASQSAGRWLTPLSRVPGLPATAGTAAGVAGRTLGSSAFPASIPVLAGEFLGRGTAHLVHTAVRRYGPGKDRFPPTAGRPVGRPDGR